MAQTTQCLEEAFAGYILRSPEADKQSRDYRLLTMVRFWQTVPQVVAKLLLFGLFIHNNRGTSMAMVILAVFRVHLIIRCQVHLSFC